MSAALPIRTAPFADARAKRSAVSAKIASFAQGHQAADVGLTLSTCWLPGGGLIAMVGAMAIQAPLVYKPMAREIAKIYLANANQPELKSLINDAAIEGAEWDVAGQFGIEFFQEIIGELVQEIGLGAILGVIPFLGAAVAAYYDAKIAATLTWRVGVSVSLFYENGCEWVVDRKTTYEKSKLLIGGGLSEKTQHRCNINAAVDEVSGLRKNQTSLLLRYLDLAFRTFGLDAVEEMLRYKWSVDDSLLSAVLSEIRARRVSEGRPSAAARSKYTRCARCKEQYLASEMSCPHCSDVTNQTYLPRLT